MKQLFLSLFIFLSGTQLAIAKKAYGEVFYQASSLHERMLIEFEQWVNEIEPLVNEIENKTNEIENNLELEGSEIEPLDINKIELWASEIRNRADRHIIYIPVKGYQKVYETKLGQLAQELVTWADEISERTSKIREILANSN